MSEDLLNSTTNKVKQIDTSLDNDDPYFDRLMRMKPICVIA